MDTAAVRSRLPDGGRGVASLGPESAHDHCTNVNELSEVIFLSFAVKSRSHVKGATPQSSYTS